MDRAHRLGQTRPVTVYRLITASTIEERIQSTAAAKTHVQVGVVCMCVMDVHLCVFVFFKAYEQFCVCLRMCLCCFSLKCMLRVSYVHCLWCAPLACSWNPWHMCIVANCAL
jgi:hypothetical protein